VHSTTDQGNSAALMRPRVQQPIGLATALSTVLAELGDAGREAGELRAPGTVVPLPEVTGITLDSRAVLPGDAYAALPGAARHGAEFTAQAVAAGAVAVITDQAGARLIGAAAPDGADGADVPVVIVPDPRRALGPLAREIFRSGTDAVPTMFGVTGTNGKTTTTYFLEALLRALDRTTGLIGTIEIRAGEEAIPSLLTTPESPQVHSLLALMGERGLDAAAMEVSSHALEFGRVDGVRFDVAGFTNLTQDHLDLHGSMEEYFAVKASLFTPERSRSAVVLVDDPWGQRLAAEAGTEVITVRTLQAPAAPASAVPTSASPADRTPSASRPDWVVTDVTPSGLGHAFVLAGPSGGTLRVRTGLPGTFNVSNAALATIMVLASGVPAVRIQQALDAHDPFTTEVPGRMQLIGTDPAAIVDFAHNPDALERTLASVRRPDGRVIAVFGATGQRDVSKRPVMGAVGARLSDILIVTDDDPHDEDEAVIRAAVRAGAEAAIRDETLTCEVLEVHPRAAAIDRAVALADAADTIVIAGRGHEVWQEVKGVNLALDDREELRLALTRHGFSGLAAAKIES
jgi:UDP-N-acetylmuramoyl-L-alanyl-D-glutamate--2,6-diaminopimelate ligase